MSDMAQKRDISDPRTVRDFAKAVKTRERLDLLTVLTVCDIRGVGPNTWNNWKATLLRGLFRATATALETGLEDLNREKLEGEGKKALREALSDWPKADVKSRDRPPLRALLAGPRRRHAGHFRRDAARSGYRRHPHRHPPGRRPRRHARLFRAGRPSGHLLALAGALSLVGANVVDARTHTTKDGFATAVFWVQDAEGNPYEAARLPRLTG
jgi:[protein-PII] uridylyltransferase